MTSRELAIYKHGGPRALAAEADRQLAAKKAHDRRLSPRKAPGRAAAEAKRKTKAEIERENRKTVERRADGRCEFRSSEFGIRCLQRAAERDHFWGRARDESVEGSWHLCVMHHHRKTDWVGGRARWLQSFRKHALWHQYAEQAARCEAAIALEEAQHPRPPHPSPAREESR